MSPKVLVRNFFLLIALVYVVLLALKDLFGTIYIKDPVLFGLLKCLPIWTLIVFAHMSSSSDEGSHGNKKYTWLITLGLLFSSGGDFALAVSDVWFVKEQGFIWGLSLFLIGHLFYVAAFGFSWNSLHVARAAPFYLFGLAVYYFALLPNLKGGLKIPVAAYILVITTMAWRAAARVGEGMKAEEKIRPKSPTEKLVVKRKMGVEGSEWSGFIGATIFVLSDLVLAINKFVFPFTAAPLVTMILYYSGQLGIAASVNWKPVIKAKKN